MEDKEEGTTDQEKRRTPQRLRDTSAPIRATYPQKRSQSFSMRRAHQPQRITLKKMAFKGDLNRFQFRFIAMLGHNWHEPMWISQKSFASKRASSFLFLPRGSLTHFPNANNNACIICFGLVNKIHVQPTLTPRQKLYGRGSLSRSGAPLPPVLVCCPLSKSGPIKLIWCPSTDPLSPKLISCILN